MKQELKIIFFGTPDFVVPVLQCLTEHFSVLGIVTTPDVLNRKKVLTPTPVKAYFQSINKVGLVIDGILNNDTRKKLQALAPDIFVVAAYGHLIPKFILDIPKFGSLNIHPSLLPKYRGPSPIQTTLLNGDTKSGVTIIQMDEAIDHGPIVAAEEIELQTTDTFASLHEKLFGIASNMLPAVIDGYTKGVIKPRVQDHAKATYCERITRQDGYFDLANPPEKAILDRMVRAYYPWPTTWTKWRGKIIKFLPEQKLQIEGKNPVSYKDFFNGHKEAETDLRALLP